MGRAGAADQSPGWDLEERLAKWRRRDRRLSDSLSGSLIRITVLNIQTGKNGRFRCHFHRWYCRSSRRNGRTLGEPVALGSPQEITYEAKVKFPKGMRPVVPQNVNVEEDFGSYTATYSFEDGVLSGIRKLKIRVNEIPGIEARGLFEVRGVHDRGPGALHAGYGRPRRDGSGMPGRMPQARMDTPTTPKRRNFIKKDTNRFNSARHARCYKRWSGRYDWIPKWGDCWVLLGNAHLMANHFDQGVQAYQKAVELEPTNLNSRQAIGDGADGREPQRGSHCGVARSIEGQPGRIPWLGREANNALTRNREI